MPNYENGKIYKIVSNQTDEVYYGSTCQKLCLRMSGHRSDFKLNKCLSISRNILKYDDAKIILVENVKCNNKEELLQKERYYIENNICINKQIPLRTKKEEYNDNKQKYLERSKNYRLNNRNKLNTKISCDCGGSFQFRSKDQHLKTSLHLNFINK